MTINIKLKVLRKRPFTELCQLVDCKTEATVWLVS